MGSSITISAVLFRAAAAAATDYSDKNTNPPLDIHLSPPCSSCHCQPATAGAVVGKQYLLDALS